jgi:hypothetical protein
VVQLRQPDGGPLWHYWGPQALHYLAPQVNQEALVVQTHQALKVL